MLGRGATFGFAVGWVLLTGSLLHFVFDWTGRLELVAPFAPVNESVWEHVKLAFWPALALLPIDPRRRRVSRRVAWVATFVASLIGPAIVVGGFYAYTAVTSHSLPADLLLFAVAVVLGQLAAERIYRRAELSGWSAAGAGIAIVIAVSALTLWSFDPPRRGLFRDGRTGGFGISHRSNSQNTPAPLPGAPRL